jgi:nitrate/TMAO reductase-like tetraheme cytochrome c subunit
MSEADKETQRQGEGEGQPRSRWQRLWRQPRARYWFGIPLGGAIMFFLGIFFWGGFHTAMDATNTLEFCTSCHEMSYVFEEYKETVHYQNASGVRAVCSDCHVPKPWAYKVVRKIKATNELFHTMLGTINTKEKFESKREEMAKHVWEDMKATDSRECRNCHALETMQLDLQGRMAGKRHTLERRLEKGETCIDCHKGIAHQLPDGY